MNAEKTTRQVTFQFEGQECHGYEIHQGVSELVDSSAFLSCKQPETGRPNNGSGHCGQQPVTLGSVTHYNNCIGTYIHGFLDNTPVIDHLLKGVADNTKHGKSTGSRSVHNLDYAAFKEEQYDKLADHVRRHVDMERIYQILRSND
jgi:adenosylcobyric acid synthase